jgi:hypothetical protein
MRKVYSVWFWIIFWFISGCFLFGWYVFLKVKNEGFHGLESVNKILPISQDLKNELQSVLNITDFFISQKGRTFTFFLLFQNNWELRPGGGYIGSFGILKIRDGRIESMEVHDTSNFDGRIPPVVEAPYPMQQTLRIDSWKLRDSNYSPDFPTNAKQAMYFYQLGKGGENFDGVIAVNASALSSVMHITGPIYLSDYGQTFSESDAVDILEYQVEKGFEEHGILRQDRKNIMRALSDAIFEKIQTLPISKQSELARMAHSLLSKKDIQLYFFNEYLEKTITESGWSGSVDLLWQNDFFMVVDANLGALKSDAKIERSVRYTVDFSREKPEVIAQIFYDHTAKQKDWMTNDYTTYTRVYVPHGSWLISTDGIDADSVRYGDEFGKKYFGFIVQVPVAQEKIVTLRYALPETISSQWYDLKIQKQSGTKNSPYHISFIDEFGIKNEYTFTLDTDTLLSNVKK